MITMKNNKPRLLLTLASAATLAAAISTDIMKSVNTNPETRADADADSDDDGYSHYYIPHEGNSTLSATFSIRVTPEHYHMFSWTILWLCFASAVAFGMYQVRLERKWLKHVVATSASSNKSSSRFHSSWRKHPMAGGGGSPSDPELGGSGGSNSRGGRNYTRSGGRVVRSSSRNGINSGSRDRMVLSASSASINSSSNPGNLGDEQAVSSGDLARATFRRLLLTAMISRTIAIPIQIYSDPLWLQLIADTFPVMAFATAWTWLVSFFVQLVGVALGTNINANLGSAGGATIGAISGSGGGPNSTAYRPFVTIDTVIQITAYMVYALLIISFTVFRRIAAAVLLYALLCCVYATLLGMGLYFCPRLLGLLLPGLGGKWHSPLALRLVACSAVCLLVFAAHTFSFARKVVQSTGPSSHMGNGPYWWFQYGALEFVPGVLFLALLHPKRTTTAPSNNSGNGDHPSKNSASGDPNYKRTPPLHSYHKRTDSSDSKSGARNTPSPQPSRSPPRQTQQPHFSSSSSSSNSNKETTPLLSSNSNNRYSGSLVDATISIDAISNSNPQHPQQFQQSGSDQSISFS